MAGRWVGMIGLLLLAAGAHAQIAPPDTPLTAARAALGRRLFYDTRLSGDGTMACATCHQQSRGFSDGQTLHRGVDGSMGVRNAMGLANVGYYKHLTWVESDVMGLEAQAQVPMMGTHPVEMGLPGKGETLIAALGLDPCYKALFARAFPESKGAMSMVAITGALASFERQLVSFDAPYDRFRRGDATALDAQARAGMALFFGERLQCAACHAARGDTPLFTDADTDQPFHRIALGMIDNTQMKYGSDLPVSDPGHFRTASLRNVALSGPWLHDGSATTLEDAIVAHNAAAPAVRAEDLAPLVAFLQALTDRHFVTDSALGPPPARCEAPGARAGARLASVNP